jgi:two-component system sensor histidine kinase BarA
MKPVSIKYQILLITLIPVFLIGLIFTYTSINNDIAHATELLQIRGQTIAGQIANASGIDLRSGNKQRIQQLLDRSINTDTLVQVSIYDLEGRLFAQSVSEDYAATNVSGYLNFRHPVMQQTTEPQKQPLADADAGNRGESLPTQALGWVHIDVSPRQLNLLKARITRDSILYYIIVLVLALGLSSIISRRVTRPIDSLIEHLKQVENGHLGGTIDSQVGNEIGALQAGFNRMTRALLSNRRQLNNRIEQATLQLSDANIDMETRNRELGFARDEAQDANRTKSEFLANMSHEIRTPINAIKGFISLMSRSELNPTQKKYADIIIKSTSDLTSIIDEILDFSKMESGKLKIVEDDFDLHEVIEQARDILFINILDKSIDLSLIIYSDTPRYVSGDRLRIKQILLNLVGNAIKFTDHGEVVIRVSMEQQTDTEAQILINVEDTGIGISESDQASLFTAFSQVDSAVNRRYSGTGLGLVISQKLAYLIGGNISLKSEPGGGTLFSFHFPLQLTNNTEQLPAEAVANTPAALIFATRKHCLQEIHTLFERAGIATEAILLDEHQSLTQIRDCVARYQAVVNYIVFDSRHFDLNLNGILNTQTGERIRIIAMHYDQHMIENSDCRDMEFISVINSSKNLEKILSRAENEIEGSSAEKPLQHTTRQARHVLIVDDNEINLELASELIRIWGHQVSTANHAQQAMERYRSQAFDLIILDIQMPDIDGTTLLAMMREEKPDDDTAIVALTANILDNVPEHLLELGFDYYLSKPIDEEKFHVLVEGSFKRGGIATLTPSNENRHSDDQCVNFQESRALTADNDSLLEKMFEILLREIPDYQQQLSDTVSESDYSKLSGTIHKIHGVTCYTSLPRLKQQVISIQRHLGQKYFSRVDSEILSMIDEFDNIRNQIQAYLRTGTEGCDQGKTE